MSFYKFELRPDRFFSEILEKKKSASVVHILTTSFISLCIFVRDSLIFHQKYLFSLVFYESL